MTATTGGRYSNVTAREVSSSLPRCELALSCVLERIFKASEVDAVGHTIDTRYTLALRRVGVVQHVALVLTALLLIDFVMGVVCHVALLTCQTWEDSELTCPITNVCSFI